MPFMIYSLVSLSAFKLIVDAIGGNLMAPYSVFLESLLFAFILAIIIRTSIRQKEAKRETLEENLEKIKQEVEGE